MPDTTATTMTAIVRDRYGPPDTVLRTVRTPRPTPGPGQVLVRVHAAGIDQGTWHLTTGLPYLTRLFGYGIRRPRTTGIGEDLAGTVTAIGEGVTDLTPGDEVMGTAPGACAQYALTTTDDLVRKPTTLTFEQAATLPTCGRTALQALRTGGDLKDRTVLIIGASGGVGTLAVALAADAGARVTGVCGPATLDLVRSLGATHVIDRTRAEITDHGHRHDLIIDTAGHRPLRLLRRALNPHGTLVIVGSEGGGPLIQGTDRQLRAALWSPFTTHTLTGLITENSPRDLAHLADLAAQGRLTPMVARTFPLTDTTAALAHVRAGHNGGKVVVLP
ncbi:NAD(P)-dependent alcohol dehydrogenase [Nocardiopsis lambiniae]|uniref:NAD(P)-dependent alcohol dehydrogenase n=1 Tax=Nocardiopsis lambiniae TaxID=3075539 RepID=A0ABU2MEA3_9ACTN|nr:NAD(P)-dependent alcohol dehydrogenase [Nocardiopsis sp. DSM 44743]MDT0330246.1 NAD(P)-dependent alcohol dehydrogenase [Nocardiopsis sp. DSM 44743]